MAAAAASPNSLLLNKNPNPLRLQNPNPSLPLPKPKPKLSTSPAISCSAATAAPSTTSYRRPVFNFAAGPATLPELFDFRSSGVSITEMSHRGREFDSSSPSPTPTPSSSSRAAPPPSSPPSPSPNASADVIVTGSWGDKAFKEATEFCNPNLIWTGKSNKYTSLPPSFGDLDQNPDASFLHICASETIHGVEFKNYPAPRE